MIFRRLSKVVLRRWFVIVGTMAAAVIVLNYPCEYTRVKSPDGRFICIAFFPYWKSLVPMTPGSGGDKSGFVEIRGANGRSLGSAPIEMVSMIHGLKWYSDAASIPCVHDWDLKEINSIR